MKKLLIAGIAAAAFCGAPALAADMPMKAAPMASMFDWSGLYVGADGGGMWTGKIGGGFFIPAAPGNSFLANHQDAGIAGVHAGLQKQWGNWVLGVEGGFSVPLGDSFGSTNGIGNAPPITCNAAVVFACQGRISSLWQVGPRLGWAQDRWMVYATGGYAHARIDTRALTLATGAILSEATTSNDGWFVGGGLEWAFAPRATFGVEYAHYNFDARLTDVNVVGAGNARFVKTDADAVRARLTLLFVSPFK